MNTTEQALEAINKLAGSKDVSEKLSFTEAVERFLEAATWLTDTDVVQVTIMQQAAAALDENGLSRQGNLLTQLGVAAREVAANRTSAPLVDEDDDFLNDR